jgi:hypothetical protein
MLAPVALFAFDRPTHLHATLNALKRNILADETPLYLFCDGPKPTTSSIGLAEVRTIARATSGFKSVTIVERDTNMGLAKSIIDGVTQLCRSHGKVIVLEDDLLTAPTFLKFMNDCLELYAKEDTILSISGFLPPTSWPKSSTLKLLPMPTSWGWATWSDRWNAFEVDGAALLNALHQRGLIKKFNGLGPYSCETMLRDQIAGRNNSWFIRWLALSCLRDSMTVYPPRSQITNIGFDGSGVHCNKWIIDPFFQTLSDEPIDVTDKIDYDIENMNALRHFYRKVRLYRYLNYAIRKAMRGRDFISGLTLDNRRDGN